MVMLILSVVLLAFNRLLSSGLKGVQHDQEAIDHTRSALLFFRSMEYDIRGVLPWAVSTPAGAKGGPMSFDPSPASATSLMFWSICEGKLQKVRYSSNPSRKEILREVMAEDGSILQSTRFATGFVETVTFSNEDTEARKVKVGLRMSGKSKSSTFARIFSRGFPDSPESRTWQFDFGP